MSTLGSLPTKYDVEAHLNSLAGEMILSILQEIMRHRGAELERRKQEVEEARRLLQSLESSRVRSCLKFCLEGHISGYKQSKSLFNGACRPKQGRNVQHS